MSREDVHSSGMPTTGHERKQGAGGRRPLVTLLAARSAASHEPRSGGRAGLRPPLKAAGLMKLARTTSPHRSAMTQSLSWAVVPDPLAGAPWGATLLNPARQSAHGSSSGEGFGSGGGSGGRTSQGQDRGGTGGLDGLAYFFGPP